MTNKNDLLNKIKECVSLRLNQKKIEIYKNEVLHYENRGKSFLENLYLFINEIDIPKCICGKNTNFIKFSQGYTTFCSVRCSANSKEKQEKIKKTCLKKYGVEYVTQSDIQKQKVRKNYLNKLKNEKYNEEVKNKRQQTKLLKYGEKNAGDFGSELYKKHLLAKFGVEFYSQTEEYKSKFKKTSYKNFFNKLTTSERLKNMVSPMFDLSDYNGVCNQKYLWKCCSCNNEFYDHIDDGHIPRCKVCFPISKSTSNLEKELSNWIKSLNIETIENTKSIISPLELDIYIPSHDLAIEFNGLYWHSELQGKNKDYHLNKTNMCQEKGIQLLHIWENEWIEKQDIVKSIIKSKLGLYDSIIHGRKCSVKQISNKEASDFYFENHIQGNINSSINLGLYYDEELVGCLSFSKPRFNKKYDWEITRFANKLNYKIHGGFSKLWKYKPEGSIITYSDKRLFLGFIYRRCMIQLKDSNPNYWYIKDGRIYSRLEFQKHKLSKLEIYDSNLTEWENMQLNKFDRIWDCGNYVYEFEHTL